MSVRNLVSASLSEADAKSVLEAIALIRSKLNFLIDLSPEERRNLAKMGDKSQAFVRKALETTLANPNAIPPNYSAANFAADLQLWDQLAPIETQLTQMSELLSDTTLALGADLYDAALTSYGILRAAGASEGLDALRASMSERFRRRSSPPAPSAPTA